MADFQQEFVTDSNIWIDLYFGELLEEVFKLPFKFMAPDVIIEELETPSGQDLVVLGLKEKELSPFLVSEVVELKGKYPRPSINDLFALCLARHLRLILLTGDGELRKAAKKERVEVHGILWLLDVMVKRKVITPARAIKALELMLAHGSRLPQRECRKRFKRWGRK
jgi:rRNA-processing protein FCF1